MSRPRNPNPPVQITFTTTAQLGEQLDSLVNSGLFGKSRAEVAERLISERIRLLIKEGLCIKDKVEL
jgi:hypothetical protein